MTGPLRVNSSQVNVRRLLAAVGSAHTGDNAPMEVTRYDWNSPRYFNEDQYNRLAAVISQVAAAIEGRLMHFFNSQLSVAPASIRQHFAAGLGDLGILKGRYFLTFGPGKDAPCGLLGITTSTARQWARRLLGDSEASDNADQPMSALEESLLTDLVIAATDAFLTPLRAHQDLRPGDRVVQGNAPLRFEPTQEVCAITFTVTGEGWNESDEMLFLLRCDTLAPLVGKSRQAVGPIPPEELSRILSEHIQQMPVTITIRLGRTSLSFEELLDLDRDDVLVLDKSLNEPVELVLDGRTIFRARPAQSAGHRAVVVTESVAAPKTSKAAPSN